MKKYVISIFMGLISLNCCGAEVASSTIDKLMMDRSLDGRVFIKLAQRQETEIECHSNPSWEFVLDIRDDQGKAMYSMLLALKASQQPARFLGLDDCSQYHNIETLRRVEAH